MTAVLTAAGEAVVPRGERGWKVEAAAEEAAAAVGERQ